MSQPIDRVALIGAGGQVGKHIFKSLQETDKKITILTRHDGNLDIQTGNATVKKVDYESEDSIREALEECQALIITLSARSPPETEPRIIEAAAKAGVQWVMPNGWSPDTVYNEKLGADVFLGPAKLKIVKRIQELGMYSLSITTGFWYEFSLRGGPERYGFDFDTRTVTLFDDGETKINTSTWELSGEAAAKVISLPISGTSPCLNDYKNGPVYVSSFSVSQKDMLASLERVTGEKWTVTGSEDSKQRYENAAKAFKEGKGLQNFAIALYSRVFYKDDSGNFEKTKGLQNDVLGLSKQDFDDCTKRAVTMPLQGWVKK